MHAAPHTHGSVIHWARGYDFLTRLIGAGPTSASRRNMIARAGLRPGEKVLDVGCGPGGMTILAAERVGTAGGAQGIDPSPGMIKLAQERAAKSGANATFRIAVIEDLPYADGTFDVVLSSFMLHHLPDDVKAKGFAEILRVLKPGGRLLAFDMSGKGLMWRLLSLTGHRLPDDYGDHLAAMMRDAGLAPEFLAPEEKQYVTVLARKAAA
jgi:demethylmenaquinone methyltransferase/2-methoxy-6-polyprenyl-1,4-benzoquinol methylase/phosphoethanolamine N-methyltransferase